MYSWIRSSVKLFLLMGGLVFLSAFSDANIESDKYDLLIKNAMVLDGSLHPAFKADVAVRDDIIIKVAHGIKGTAGNVIDADGLYLSPGFIDLHTHADRNMTFPEHRGALNYLKQGVTSLVVGQCGGSAWNIFEKAEDQVKRWEETGIGPNAALLVGHGTVRNIVMGMENREPTELELKQMQALVTEAMEQGASGISTGLIYLPGRYAKTDELVELVKMVASYGGIYHTHIRNESENLLGAVSEAIAIARATGVNTHISHFKVMGRKNWGMVTKACELIEKARREGLVITADQYPYRFANGNPYRRIIPDSIWYDRKGPSRLTSKDINGIFDHLRDYELIELYKKTTPYIPLNANHELFLHELSRERLVAFVGQALIRAGDFRGPGNARERRAFIKRLNDPVAGKKIRKQVNNYIENLVGYNNFVVGICNEKNYEGKTIAEVAALMEKSPVETAIQLELMDARCIPMQMDEKDIEYIMQRDYVGTGSDGTVPNYGHGVAHIRAYSTFLHKMKKYALERKSVSIEHVIRSQTSLPAKIMNWPDRGRIKAGYKADIAVFDLSDLRLRTSISNPHQYSEGVKFLLINGKLVLEKGRFTGVLPGKVITLQQ